MRRPSQYSRYCAEFDFALTYPPVSPKQYAYFEDALPGHPFGAKPSLRNAWWLSECALASYCEVDDAAVAYAQAGLDVAGGGPVRGPRQGGQCYVLFDAAKVILAFRGTQVVLPDDLGSMAALKSSIGEVSRDVRTDTAIPLVPWTGRSKGRVHSGFRASFEEMCPEICARLEPLLDGRSLWLCGHSLGGALATLAADRLDDVSGVYSFGSPAVGDADFATRWDVPGIRFRNFTDIVPWLPSRVLNYRHVRGGMYFNRHGRMLGDPSNSQMLADAFLGAPFTAIRSFRGIRKGSLNALEPRCLLDHAPLEYVRRVWRGYETALSRVELNLRAN